MKIITVMPVYYCVAVSQRSWIQSYGLCKSWQLRSREIGWLTYCNRQLALSLKFGPLCTFKILERVVSLHLNFSLVLKIPVILEVCTEEGVINLGKSHLCIAYKTAVQKCRAQLRFSLKQNFRTAVYSFEFV